MGRGMCLFLMRFVVRTLRLPIYIPVTLMNLFIVDVRSDGDYFVSVSDFYFNINNASG